MKTDSTAIGDPAITAARLEALTRAIDTPVLIAGEVAAASRRDWDIRFVGACDISGDAPTRVHSLATGATDMTSMRSAIAKYLDTATDWWS